MIDQTRNPLAPLAVRYLTDRDLVARFSVSRATIWRWVSEGFLTPVRLTPGTTRFLLADIETFEAQRRAASAVSGQERDTAADKA